MEFWNRVIFTNESKFYIFDFDGHFTLWRNKKKKKNEKYKPQNLQPTIKHGGGSMCVWGCMSAAGTFSDIKCVWI